MKALSDTFREVFRPLGTRYQLSATMLDPGPVLLAMVLNRGSRDFTERDRLVLNLLRPHLARAYAAASAAGALAEQCERQRLALEALDVGLIVLAERLRVVSWSESAARWLGAYFPAARPAPEGGGPSLPDEVLRWAGQTGAAPAGAPPAPLVIEGSDGRLTLRLLPHAAPGRISR